MKRFFTFLLISAFGLPVLFAQVKLTKETHGFLSGDDHECRKVNLQDPGKAGQNIVWDYSQAVLLEDVSNSHSDIEANFDGEGNVKAVRNDNINFFFKITANANEYWGYKVGNTTYKLVEPIVKTKYPQEYGTQFDGKYSGIVLIEGSDYSRPIDGTYSTHADATGTILLPNDVVLPALRVRTTESTGARELVKYLWYTQDVRFPIFVIFEDYSIDNDGAKTLTYTESFLNTNLKNLGSANAVKQVADNVTYNVSPNPFTEEINLNYSLPEATKVNIELFDAKGAKIVTLVSNEVQTGAISVSKNVAQYTSAPGVYVLKIKIGNKTYTEKIVKKN
ncbi:hypothetical protein FACS1894160_0340 [Bacteroidia bacterium]|nr:hypothetical protein FACS1894160_0340 [Bacteroidia bacterium]